MANEALEIRPSEFWALTPAEVSDMIAGAHAREERSWQRTAWHVAHELNVAGKSLKKSVSAEQLLGKQSKEIKPIDPAADFETLWGRIQERDTGEVN